MRAGELCAGYGGLALAVEDVFGAETAWFSEFDPAPSKILAHHWPGVPNHGDMTAIDWEAIEQVDVMSGGTPCQDLSAAGRRKGMTEGTRSNLWVHMREAIAAQQPEWVVWENVRGAYSANASSDLEQCPGCLGDSGNGEPVLRALGRVLGDLSDLGYDTEWRGLRAADVGACHGRFRVFVLARRRAVDDTSGVGGRQTVKHYGSGAATDDRASVPDQSDRDAVRTRPKRENTATDADSERHERPRAARDGRDGSANDGEPPADIESDGRGEGWTEPTRQFRGLAATGDRASTDDANRRDDDGRLSDEKRCAFNGTPTARCGPVSRADIFAGRWCACETPADHAGAAWDGSKQRDLSASAGSTAELGELASPTNWGDYEPAIRRWEARLGRPAPRPTEPTGRNNGERLSPRFTEWMMGLPDGWVTDPAIGITRNEQLKACGNGVVPQQAMAALRDMLNAFQEMAVAA